ncbi:Two-component transcriptional response regulator, LuxR family [hydrothermal vent metagenome]|uniref:Two-component transcriptional response regulator, LuxR family n=1 Tax=hydrothermal vent metagenome TaxID=652676 RepID=A0A3B0ZE89_9ZZZZ
MPNRILIIEDNPDIANLVSIHLKDNGYAVAIENNGQSGLERAQNTEFQLIILDLMLPKIDGLQICRELRGQHINTPILMLTAKSSEVDRVLGLEIGADDYLTKPFSIQELLARVKAIFRRIECYQQDDETETNKNISVGHISLDANTRIVKQKDRAIDLTAKEFDLLWYFASHPGRVYSRSQLLDQVWGYGHDGYEHTVNSHINRLRSKIEDDPANPEFILTVWGVGYKFSTDTDKTQNV